MTALRRQYARNAVGLRALLARAERTGKPANGATADELRAHVATFERLAVASDAEILAHLIDTRARIAARLQEIPR